uniref:Uncharacterized protein n=1 Tax=Parascaris univalens TaxID=6257 RepID=A0A915ACR6_PARUN
MNSSPTTEKGDRHRVQFKDLEILFEKAMVNKCCNETTTSVHSTATALFHISTDERITSNCASLWAFSIGAKKERTNEGTAARIQSFLFCDCVLCVLEFSPLDNETIPLYYMLILLCICKYPIFFSNNSRLGLIEAKVSSKIIHCTKNPTE